jgi:2'-5' RNA ligase
VRCFVAVDVAPEVRSAIVRARAALRAAARHGDVRWNAPAAFHVTLKFLGAVADERVPAISAAVGRAIAGAEPLALAAAGLGAFPSRARARVLWAGVAVGGESVAALASAIDAALAPLGFPVETRPFHAHLTIGARGRSRGSRHGLLRHVDGGRGRPLRQPPPAHRRRVCAGDRMAARKRRLKICIPLCWRLASAHGRVGTSPNDLGAAVRGRA